MKNNAWKRRNLQILLFHACVLAKMGTIFLLYNITSVAKYISVYVVQMHYFKTSKL